MREYHRNESKSAFSFSVTELLKYGTIVAILVFMLLMMIYNSGSTKPFKEVASAVEASIDKEGLVRQDAQALKRYYGLNSADYEGVLFYSSEFSISAEEILLIEVKNEQQVQSVRDALEERIEKRRDAFDGYAPEQVQLLDEARIQVRGNYIFLAVAPQAETYNTVFSESL